MLGEEQEVYTLCSETTRIKGYHTQLSKLCTAQLKSIFCVDSNLKNTWLMDLRTIIMHWDKTALGMRS